MTNSTGKVSHSRATVTVGSGTLMTWFGTRFAVASNQNAAIWFSTWPLNGIVPSTTSNALMRSVAISVRLPSRTYESRTLPSYFSPSSGKFVAPSVLSSWARRTASSIDLLMPSPFSWFLCKGPVDDGAGVAQVVLEIEGAVDLARFEARGDVLVGGEQVAKLALPGHGAQRVSLDQLVGGLTGHSIAL